MFSTRNSDFQGAGKEPGVQVWRIEKLKPVPLKPADFGIFHSGDSYVVLKTSQKPNSGALVHDIFFWLGEDSSQDEEGTAALKVRLPQRPLPVRRRALSESSCYLRADRRAR